MTHPDMPKPDDDPPVRLVHLLVTGLALLGLAVFGARGVAAVSEHVGRPPHFRPRLVQLVRALPSIADADRPLLVLGASEVHRGVSPRLLDADLARLGQPTTSYNLGLAVAPLDAQREFTRDLARAFRAHGRRARATVIAIVGSELSEAPRPALSEDYEVLLDSPPDLVAEARRHPERGLRIAWHKYALADATPFYVGFRFARALDEDWPALFDPGLRRAKLERPPAGLEWDVASRGDAYPNGVEPTYRRWYESAVDARKALLAENLEIEANGDVLDRHAIDDALGWVREARSFSDQVLVVVMPRNPCAPPPSEQRRRELADALARLAHEAGSPLIDLTNAMDRCDDFEDLSHVEVTTGVPELNHVLAEALAKALASRAAN